MAITERYVSATGGGTHDGTTEANAFTWAEMITDINTPRVGYRYWVKGAISLTGTTTITGDGDATSPNVIAGYNSTIGDVTFLRGSDGKLIETNMPVITYDSTFGFTSTSGNFLVLAGMKFVGERASPLLTLTAADTYVFGCVINNTSTSASAGCISQSSTTGNCLNCDMYLPNAADGATALLNGIYAVGNRIQAAAAVDGITTSGTTSLRIEKNTIIGCKRGIVKTNTGGAFDCFDNTIVGAAGDGIDIVTGTTVRCTIIGNHITGCGGYGIDFNTSTCVKILAANRFRDNTSGSVNGGGDYETATSWMRITSDDSDADDFADSGSGIYSLKSTAAGYQKSLGFLNNIGAAGSTVSGGGGGAGPLISGRLVR